ncbi:PAS domain-containing protein, partial [Corallococcus sp. AB030]|uniref:PAS domain-containing protein n=1 Tax=Corallococcus sp. AB030 TaxID=2316716 RepID=UPI0011E5B14B
SQPQKLKSVHRTAPIADSHETKDRGNVSINQSEANDERLVGDQSTQSGLFKTFFNDCSAPCFVKDDQGCYVFINDEFERQFGVNRNSFLGSTAASWVGEETAKKIRLRDYQVLTDRSTSSDQEVLPNADGVLRNWIVHRFT